MRPTLPLSGLSLLAALAVGAASAEREALAPAELRPHRSEPTRRDATLGDSCRTAVEPEPERVEHPELAWPRPEPEVAEAEVAPLLVAAPRFDDGGRLREHVDLESFDAGRGLFERVWTPDEGLGAPHFNEASCVTCHREPGPGGAGDDEFNVLVTTLDDPEGAGGSSYLGRMRDDRPRRERLEASRRLIRDMPFARAVTLEVQTPSLLGAGRLDAVTDSEILSREDPDDLDGDGVTGVARRVRRGDVEEIGRFGWKAGVPRLADFVRAAAGGEVGLTTPDQGRGFGLSEDDDGVADPELSQAGLDDLAYFVGHLAPPTREAVEDPEVLHGESLFLAVGCAACHAETLYTEELEPVHAYTDLLLHEVERDRDRKLDEALDDLARAPSFRDRLAPEGIRTPPLWGVRDTAPYWHDGRAATLSDAILLHGGEARASRERYVLLSTEQREELMAFLTSL